MADMCLHCGTVPNPGEKKCATPDEVRKCPWMVGVHRGVIIEPQPPKKSN